MSENMEQSLDSLLIPSLPNEPAVDIVARVPRSHYPTLSLVSKSFRKLIASPRLYKRRSELGITQHRLYAVLRNPKGLNFYIIHRKLNCRNRLVFVKSISCKFTNGYFVPVGSRVYMFNTYNALSFDCTSHTYQRMSDIPLRMCCKLVRVVEKKIYVIGSVEEVGSVEEDGRRWRNAVTVFDTETQSWELKEGMSVVSFWGDFVVMEGKVYMNGHPKINSFVFDEVLNSKDWKGACVVDNVFYHHDCSETALMAFDPKQSCWSVVNGLEDFLAAETAQSKWSTAVNYGEKKLALFFSKDNGRKVVISCAEIALERRQGGEIWGQMESCDVVIEDGLFETVQFVSVTV